MVPVTDLLFSDMVQPNHVQCMLLHGGPDKRPTADISGIII